MPSPGQPARWCCRHAWHPSPWPTNHPTACAARQLAVWRARSTGAAHHLLAIRRAGLWFVAALGCTQRAACVAWHHNWQQRAQLTPHTVCDACAVVLVAARAVVT